MPHDPKEPHLPPLPPGRRNDPVEDETDRLVRDTQRELWDTARPEGLHPDDVATLAAEDRRLWASSDQVDQMLREGEDTGGGEPLRARVDELPTGPVSPQEYRERPYWALAVVTIGVAVLIATIVGNVVIIPFLFASPPAVLMVGWPWVVATLVGILAGLVVARATWSREHYGQIWGPATAATFAGLLVAAGALAAIWYLVPLGV